MIVRNLTKNINVNYAKVPLPSFSLKSPPSLEEGIGVLNVFKIFNCKIPDKYKN